MYHKLELTHCCYLSCASGTSSALVLGFCGFCQFGGFFSLPLFSGFVPWPVAAGARPALPTGLGLDVLLGVWSFIALWGLWQGRVLDDLQGRNRGFGHDLELNGSSKK